MRWTLVHKPPFGSDSHRIFRSDGGLISLADRSGETPTSTDDGPLIVDPGAEVEASVFWSDKLGGVYFNVPVRCERDKKGHKQEMGLVMVDIECMQALMKVVPVVVKESEGFRRVSRGVDLVRVIPRKSDLQAIEKLLSPGAEDADTRPSPLGGPAAGVSDESAITIDLGPVVANPEADAESRAMFVARLENMRANGSKSLSVNDVLALLNDCDMVASQSAFARQEAGDERPRQAQR